MTGVIAALSACGSDSTAPAGPPTAAQLATQFDKIYSADITAGGSANDNAADIVASLPEAAAAYGGTETAFTATTGAGPQTWYGIMYAQIVNSGADTVFEFTFYPNADLDTAIFGGLEYSGGSLIAGIGEGSTDRFVQSSFLQNGQGGISIVSTGAACSLQMGLAADSAIQANLNTPTSCVSGTFSATLAITFAAAAGMGADSTVSLANVTFQGAVLTSSGASRVVGIPSSGARFADRARWDAVIRRR